MKKYFILVLLISVLFISSETAFAKGGFSGGGVHSSGSFSSGFHSTSFSGGAIHSSGSFGGSSSYHSSGGFKSPIKSGGSMTTGVGSLFGTSKSPAQPSAPSQTVIYHDTYSYNPFYSNFWFWMWMFDRHNSTPTIINQHATTTAATK